MEDYFDTIELENLYQWVDGIPLSRPKTNIGKDFSDAVLVAEIIKHYFPCLVDICNYHPSVGTKPKMENWFLLNRKVLHNIGMDLSVDIIKDLANSKQNAVEKLLYMLRYQIDKHIEKFGIKNKAWQKKRNHMSKEAEVVLNKARSSVDDWQDLAKWKSQQPVNIPVVDNVPRQLLEDKIMECTAKDETIQILIEKINRMKHLLKLKDVKLQELETQITEQFISF